MALRFPATALELDIASCVQLELIESAAPGRLDAPPALDACPSPDDLLDFCQGTLVGSRAIVLQQHLDLCLTCMDVATLSLNDWEPPVAPGEWFDVALNFRCGERVEGRYEIVRFIASGGMGEVYEALDLHSGERVALKAILAAASDNRDLLRCFRREARLARRVRHPNVCHVHDEPAAVGAIARPLVPYFTLDLIDGVTLHERLSAGPLALYEAIEIAGQMLLGIEAMHQAGVIHLDIKSNNVMLRRGPELRVVILDFGLARRVEEGVCSDRASARAAISAFNAPEHLRGCAPGVQNDMFAFGVVLFQMLTGRAPFARGSGSPGSRVGAASMTDAPVPSELVSGVPPWLDAVIRRCLVGRAERFRDAAEVTREFAAARAP